MGLLSDKAIMERIKTGSITIENFDEKQLAPASYNLRLGEEAFKSSPQGKISIKERGLLVIEPGQFVIFTTLESIKLSKQLAGHIGVRSYYTRKGLVPLLGPQLDPGYRGKPSINVFNVGTRDVVIPYGEPVCTVEFYELPIEAEKPYTGPYQDKYGILPEDIQFLAETKGATLRDVFQTISSLSDSVNRLTESIKWIKWFVVVMTPVMLALFGIVIAIVLAKP